MGSSLLDTAMFLLDKPEVKELMETAKFYYTDSNTNINLYPALAITGIMLLLIIPLLGSIPSIDLLPSFSAPSPYGQTDSYGAPEPSYGAPSSGYGAPSRQSQWGRPEDYRSFQNDDSDALKQLYSASTWQPTENEYTNAARSFQVETPVETLLTNTMKLLQ